MKNLFLLILIALTVSSCGNKLREGGEDILVTYEFEIPPGLNTYISYYNVFPQEVGWGNTYTSIIPVRARLVSINGEPLDFFREVSLEVLDKTTTQPPLEFAYRDPVPGNTGIILDFIPNSLEMKSYIGNDFAMRLRYEITVDPFQFIPCRLEVTFRRFTD